MTPIRVFSAAVLTALLAAAPSLASTDARIDSLVNAVMAKRLIPGAAVVVVRDGEVVKKTAYGLASVELQAPATSRTLFQIASVTKNMTAVAVMQLVEAGRFGLDDRICDLLPGLPAAWRPVTVRNLLGHTSGLPDVILDPEKGVWLPGSRDSMLHQLASMPAKPAGTEWAYNQTNYMLLGMLVEKASGMPFTEYCRRQVFEPMGMTGVVFGDSRLVAPGRASEYTRLDIDPGATRLTDLHAFSYEYPEALLTAAGIFMNADDMARWMVGVQNGATLSRRDFETMTTTVTIDGKPFHFPDTPMGYGLGWMVIDDPDHRAVGGSGGGRCAVLFHPEEGLAIAVMTNLQGAGPEDLVERIAGIVRSAH